jgi:hypothetical protein
MPKHDCLPPRRTGRADFPHPALTQTLAAPQYASRKADLAGPPSLGLRWELLPTLRSGFRRGTLVQAEFPPSDSACLRSGPFAPRSLPASSLLWAGPTPNRGRSRVMFSSEALVVFPTTPPGLPGSSTDLSPRAVPFHPGKSHRCFCPLLHGECQASSHLEDWPLSLRANGAVSGSLALRLAGSPSRASPAELLPPTPGRLPVE